MNGRSVPRNRLPIFSFLISPDRHPVAYASTVAHNATNQRSFVRAVSMSLDVWSGVSAWQGPCFGVVRGSYVSFNGAHSRALFSTAVSARTSLLIVFGATSSMRFIWNRRMSHAVMLLRRRSDPITSLRWRQDVCSAATDAFGRVAARYCIQSVERLSQSPLRFVRGKLVLPQFLQEIVLVVASLALL